MGIALVPIEDSYFSNIIPRVLIYKRNKSTFLTMSDPETTSMNGDNDSDAAASLDHTLLESLFYNEMMLLDESSFLSPDFMSALAADSTLNVGTSNGYQPQAGHSRSQSQTNIMYERDANTLAETDLLQDFGVSSRPFGPVTTRKLPGTAVAPAVITSSASESPSYANQSSRSAIGELTQQTFRQPQNAPETSRMPLERAKQLVSQFATLASRLGISLPQNVLSSLTQQVEAKEAEKFCGESPSPTEDLNGFEGSSSPETSPKSIDSIVQHLSDTADAAMITASETRKRNQADSLDAAKAPLHSKRRKKPRLSDCESKLASLKSENEMLKRHLDTIANKSQKFDQERKEAETEMKRLIQEDAGPEKLNPLLSKFSQMYSDYGSHRHQELTFHLEQLERLAAPTNFTKMGLWTLGQNEGFYTDLKRNPIASILSKELGINPQQGRKILEQRQKIRDLSANLKECLGLLERLKSLCEHKQKVFHDRMSKCQEILTPLQVVKLLLWVDDHSNLLETVCPGWGSERIQPTKDKNKGKSGKN